MKEHPRPLVAFAMIEAGGGHRSPAIAVERALRARWPNRYRTQVLDFMKDLGCLRQDARHKRTWDFLLSHPLLSKASYLLSELAPPVARAILLRFLRPFIPVVVAWVRREQPAMVVSMHYFNTVALVEARRQGAAGFLLASFVTEAWDTPRFWTIPGVDHTIVSTEEGRRTLIRRGIPRRSISVCTFPVRRGRRGVRSGGAETRRRLGISNGNPVLLVTFGAQGVGRIHHFLAAMARARMAINVIVVAGRNESLRKDLLDRYAAADRRMVVVPLGYVEEMNELINAADICFIKPGVSTTLEVLAYRKPIVFYRPGAFGEGINIRAVQRMGVGFPVQSSPARFVRVMRRLLDAKGYRAVVARYRGRQARDGAVEVASRLHKLLARGAG
jgi:processive 1,2-diacylglycerol beta-glucosyltransferase